MIPASVGTCSRPSDILDLRGSEMGKSTVFLTNGDSEKSGHLITLISGLHGGYYEECRLLG
jgi:hypothetical protein